MTNLPKAVLRDVERYSEHANRLKAFECLTAENLSISQNDKITALSIKHHRSLIKIPHHHFMLFPQQIH